MMATTHVLVGVGIAAVASVLVPDLSLVAVVAAGLGGAVPDLDLYAGHRKTLHYPVYYSIASVVLGGFLFVGSTPFLWAAWLFLSAAAVHSLMDAFGGGLELRPWLGTSRRAVYSHYHGRWIRPKRWIRYDGAPEDLGLALVASIPSVLAFDGALTAAVGVLLAVSLVYVLLRKPMVTIAEWLVVRIPETHRVRIPRRFVEERS